MKDKKIKYIGLIIFCFLCGSFYLFTRNTGEEKTFTLSKEIGVEITGAAEEKETAESSREEEKIYVHICGAVLRPGVYEMEKDARVYEAIELAGGMVKEAAADGLNQAAGLTDGEQLYIPYESEAETEHTAPEREMAEDKRVNLNTAEKEELMTLPGIGESKAESIINYREENGGFKEIEELTNITGIKNGVYEKIKELVRIR